MIDKECAVEVGVHIGVYWRDKNTGLIVCTRHKAQFSQRIDLGPYDWEQIK